GAPTPPAAVLDDPAAVLDDRAAVLDDPAALVEWPVLKRLFLLSFIWGWSFLFIKVAVEGMTPTTVAGGRVALGALVLHVVLHARGMKMPADRTLWLHFSVVALVGSAIPFTLLAWGEERITSALTAVTNASTPLFTVLFGVAVLRSRIRGAQAAGLLLGLAGVAVAAGVGGSDLSSSSMAGVMASVGAGACYGLSFAWSKRHLMGIPPMVAATGQLTMAAVIMAPFALATSAAEGIDLTFSRAGSILLLGLIGTGIAYVINFGLIHDLGPTRASLSTYIIPVVAVLVGVVVLDEQFHLRLLAGGALIVFSVAIVHERLLAPTRVPVAPLPLLMLLLLVLGGCGTDDDDEAATATTVAPPTCDEPVDEAADPTSSVHVLPGAPEPEYTTDPPTSGPHQAVGEVEPVQSDPMPRPVQVGVLESGRVLVQYGPDIDGEALTSLRAVAGDEVVLAPNNDLPAPVVATAWLRKMTCDGVDTAAIERFVVDTAGLPDESHG
ncbi:MAG: EamA family transporter, partial [Actinomycetota bacterium]